MPESTRQLVQQHVESCQRCADELRQIERAGAAVERLRRVEPQLHDQRDMTEQILRGIASARTEDARPPGQGVVLPFRRLQIACTLGAAFIVAAFFIQNITDADHMATLESRLNRFPSDLITSTGEPPLTAVGLNTIAEVGKFLSRPPAMDTTSFHEWLRLRDAVRSFFDVLQEGPPGFLGEVQRLRMKYPELWYVSPLNGLTAQDHIVLARQGKALMKDLRTLLQPGNSNHEK